jgi:putative endonuclease
MAAHNDFGKWGEQFAAQYLERNGYIILERDWHLGHKDLDIIALKDNKIIFVEVKSRSKDGLMDVMLAIDEDKRRNLLSAGKAYMQHRNYDHDFQYDVIIVIGTDEVSARIEHIPNCIFPKPRYYGGRGGYYYRR